MQVCNVVNSCVSNVMFFRTLRAALNLQTLTQMSKTLPDKRAVSKHMVKLIDLNNIVKHELEIGQADRSQELTTVTNALAEVISKSWGQDETAVLDDEAREHLTRFVDVLRHTYCGIAMI